MIRALRQRAGKRQPAAAAQADVLTELRGLRARVPHVTGALAASADGLLLAQDTSGVEADQVASLITTALGIALRVTHATGQGTDLRELLIRGSDGYVATYPAGRTTVLTLFAQDQVNVGRLHLEGRRTGRRIGELVDAEPADASARPAPATRTTPAGGRNAAAAPTDAPADPADTPPGTRSKSAAKAEAKAPAEAAPTRSRTARAPRTTSNARPTTDS